MSSAALVGCTQLPKSCSEEKIMARNPKTIDRIKIVPNPMEPVAFPVALANLLPFPVREVHDVLAVACLRKQQEIERAHEQHKDSDKDSDDNYQPTTAPQKSTYAKRPMLFERHGAFPVQKKFQHAKRKGSGEFCVTARYSNTRKLTCKLCRGR